MKSRRLTVFSFFWALFILIHQTDEGRLTGLDFDLVLNVAAAACLVRPSSSVRFLSLCVVQLIAVWLALPHIQNHWMLASFVSMVFLFAFAGRRPEAAFPLLRIMLVLVYFFAFLAKLNPAFLNPPQSCAAYFYLYVADRIPMLPTRLAAQVFVIHVTLIVECLIPISLCFRRTRFHGVLLGIFFHLLMGMIGFYEFAAIHAAFFVLFLDEDALARMKSPGWLQSMMNIRGSVAIVLCLFYSVYFLFAWPAFRDVLPASPTGDERIYYLIVTWLVTASIAILVLLRSGIRTSSEHGVFRIKGVAAYTLLALFLFNGLCPYLGLKTEHSFVMFSNLRTEAEQWNSWVVPQAFRIFSYQDELVKVLDSNDARYKRMAERLESIPFSQVESDLDLREGLKIRYQRGEEDIEASADVQSRIAGKLMSFRAIPDGNTCRH